MSRAYFAQNVSRETLERLDIYAELLQRWNPRINLVAKSTLEDLWSRHFLDSQQVFDAGSDGTHWVDLGSGGGFPGLVAAILAKDVRPDMHFTLVESDQRKCAFLRNVSRETQLGARIESQRIEAMAPLRANILSARALAALPMLLSFAERHLDADGTALFPKGARWQDEVAAAEQNWRFRYEARPSKTDPEAVILKIGGISRVEPAHDA